MQIDYLRSMKFNPRKFWWNERLTEEQLKEVMAPIRKNHALVNERFASFNISDKDLIKHSLVIPTYVDYEALADGKVVPRKGHLFVYFFNGENPFLATID